jgi:hypothetical protein
MKLNVGIIERVVRVMGGASLLVFAYMAGQPLAYLGAIPLITGLVGFCPAYRIFNFSTKCYKKGECCTTK